MKNKIQIKANRNHFIGISLLDILDLIDKPENYKWSILWIEAIGEIKNDTMLDFEIRVNKSTSGYMVRFSDLVNLAKSFTRVIEILIIGDENINNLKRYDIDHEMHSNCNFCLELVDSSYWDIYSNDMIFLKTIKEKWS